MSWQCWPRATDNMCKEGIKSELLDHQETKTLYIWNEIISEQIKHSGYDIRWRNTGQTVHMIKFSLLHHHHMLMLCDCDFDCNLTILIAMLQVLPMFDYDRTLNWNNNAPPPFFLHAGATKPSAVWSYVKRYEDHPRKSEVPLMELSYVCLNLFSCHN